MIILLLISSLNSNNTIHIFPIYACDTDVFNFNIITYYYYIAP